MGYGSIVPVDSTTIQRNSNSQARLGAGTGTLAARPAASTAGQMYFGTDTNTFYYDTGSTWVTFAASSIANTFSQLITFQAGLALNPAIADASVAGKLFLSSTTANTLKYYDTQATPALHSIAALDLAQTWTGIQTFAASGVKLQGAGAGVGTFVYANSATSGTLTFPAVTDTLAVLGTAQTWTGVQTFGNNISIGGAQLNVSALASGNVLQYNGTNWVNVTLATAPVSSVSNTDGSLTISPTTGAVIASIASAGVTPEKLGNVVRLSADTSVANIVGSSGLTKSLSVNTNYMFKACLWIVETGGAVGEDIQIHALAAGAALSLAAGIAVNGTTTATGAVTAVSVDVFGGAGIPNPSVGKAIVTVWGVITVGATATTLQIDINAVNTVLVKTGSFLEVSKVA